MAVDYTKIQFSSSAASLKVWKEGSATISVPALGGAGEVTASTLIPHGYTSDRLITQVTAIGGGVDGVLLPWTSNDGRVMLYSSIDSTNLTVTCIDSDISGFGHIARTITVYYRILIP